MSELANCMNCGALFVKVNQTICVECQSEEEKWLQVISDYLRQHEDQRFTQHLLMEKTKIPFKFLQSLIRSGRLKLSRFPNLEHYCERCNELTQEERFCHTCLKELKKELSEYEQQKHSLQQHSGERIRNKPLNHTLQNNR